VSEQHLEREQRVTPLELLFDLVFVFAFTQATTVLSDNPTWSGLGHALVILVALWWALAAYAWLTNVADPNEGRVWGTMVVAMAAMFVAALAVPDAFGRHAERVGQVFDELVPEAPGPWMTVRLPQASAMRRGSRTAALRERIALASYWWAKGRARLIVRGAEWIAVPLQRPLLWLVRQRLRRRSSSVRRRFSTR
jgi:hypothetical protein